MSIPSCRRNQMQGMPRAGLYDGTTGDITTCRAAMKTADGFSLHDGVQTKRCVGLFDKHYRIDPRNTYANQDDDHAVDEAAADVVEFLDGQRVKIALKASENVAADDILIAAADGLFVKSTGDTTTGVVIAAEASNVASIAYIDAYWAGNGGWVETKQETDT